ncbi:ligase-associated DNA damage response DEXH box helicase [Burkholderiaceae bacterium FT117]|uniref:ligase-associated DNA damage response DEXH box helicase n=1 Tax=Zeimonas sediminis TaxID=2944268 RepID=UPI002342FFEC|nr:ligase-associated DNA damage response DEXH box helicase [Zeimonas sediminis]MCM5570835.1 ligase-associated DNA damage response DEXH box helicase [Zeimonas sediminis]
MSKAAVPIAAADRWFAARGLKPFAFQREVWRAMRDGESGLLHATTGAGKTWSAWIGALLRVSGAGAPPRARLRVLWITPMRALAADTALALREPLAELGDGAFAQWTVGLRTGDTATAERQRQDRSPPPALVTTPESLSLMLSRPDADAALGAVEVVVVDEWHELLGNKRGVQLQLALARLRRLNPRLLVWGLSATLGNLDEARDVLLAGRPGRLVQGRLAKRLVVDALLPGRTGRFPWAGHLGLSMLEAVVRELDASPGTLVFCNTRAQAELWYQALLDARPDWAGAIALHHGSLDREVRDWVEAGIKRGALKAVVCTSSLDLGVDFAPVERVLQVGSAKGVARLLQRAGRSGHAPGRPSRVTLVPTNALELVEAAAARDAATAGRIESREPPEGALDVLVQHLVTVAAGPGFRPDALLAEVRDTHAYRGLTDQEWRWALDFVLRGGASLTAYPDYRRVAPDDEGVHRVADPRIARRHRMAIGTIVSDAALQVRFMTGQRLGSVEESFVGRLRRGDCFLFAGRLLELVRVHEMTAWVRRATGRRAAVPRWNGGRMPLSTEMSDAVLARLAEAGRGRFEGPEMKALRPLLELQSTVSALPDRHTLLVEALRSREGAHLFVFPFAGRQVHLGLASLLAMRLARRAPATFSIAVNDYGFELLSPAPVDWAPMRDGSLLSAEGLLDDVLDSLNSGELAMRRFREIARIAGLLFPGYPGAPKGARQLQASASLFWEVFRQHDPGNLLLDQARREVLERELEVGRLRRELERIGRCRLRWVELQRPSPFAFPLMVERMRERLSTEKLSDRVARLVAELERAAGADR